MSVRPVQATQSVPGQTRLQGKTLPHLDTLKKNPKQPTYDGHVFLTGPLIYLFPFLFLLFLVLSTDLKNWCRLATELDFQPMCVLLFVNYNKVSLKINLT